MVDIIHMYINEICGYRPVFLTLIILQTISRQTVENIECKVQTNNTFLSIHVKSLLKQVSLVLLQSSWQFIGNLSHTSWSQGAVFTGKYIWMYNKFISNNFVQLCLSITCVTQKGLNERLLDRNKVK